MSGIFLDRRGPVAELRLDNPSKLNALTPEMLGQLQVHCETLELAGEVREIGRAHV